MARHFSEQRRDQAVTERRVFTLDADRWSALVAALDAPPRLLPRMQKLLTEPGYFDSESV
jgi:uncharacterized protein (DUF1778 family)